jgi:hypothetical protein
MGIITAARKPKDFIVNAFSINWIIQSSYPGGISPVEYEIFQSSFYDNQAEDLGMNVSPFAQDRFVQSPAYPSPPLIAAQSQGGTVDLVITEAAIAISEYTCYDGWIEPALDQIGLSDTEIVRNITLDSPAYLTSFLTGIDQLKYVKNGVTGYQTAIPAITEEPFTIPIMEHFVGAIVGDKLQIQFWDIGILYTVNFQVTCRYEKEARTIGFINRFGMWEFFDCIGRSDIGSNKKNENYISAASGLNKTYLTNGNRTLQVNTGFQEEGFANVIEDLLMSNTVILYTGDVLTSVPLILKNTSEEYLTSRHNKVEINYLLRFETAAKIIPIV